MHPMIQSWCSFLMTCFCISHSHNVFSFGLFQTFLMVMTLQIKNQYDLHNLAKCFLSSMCDYCNSFFFQLSLLFMPLIQAPFQLHSITNDHRKTSCLMVMTSNFTIAVISQQYLGICKSMGHGWPCGQRFQKQRSGFYFWWEPMYDMS